MTLPFLFIQTKMFEVIGCVLFLFSSEVSYFSSNYNILFAFKKTFDL